MVPLRCPASLHGLARWHHAQRLLQLAQAAAVLDGQPGILKAPWYSLVSPHRVPGVPPSAHQVSSFIARTGRVASITASAAAGAGSGGT